MMDRRLMAQRAVVGALHGAINAAIVMRDDAMAQEAHDALIRAEFRLMSLEHVRCRPEPIPDDFDVIDPEDSHG